MAKVKGPLMSMGATGQLGKSLVFMTWKGIKDVRTHVVPANPRSDGQVAQRNVMKSAVASWHAVLFNALDLAAFNVLASLQAGIMSGFNAFCKLFINCANTAIEALIPYGMVVSSNTGGSFGISLTLAGNCAGKLRWGSSATVMGNSADLVHAAPGNPYTYTLTGLTAGSYVYLQAYTEVADTFFLTGVYKVLVLE